MTGYYLQVLLNNLPVPFEPLFQKKCWREMTTIIVSTVLAVACNCDSIDFMVFVQPLNAMFKISRTTTAGKLSTAL